MLPNTFKKSIRIIAITIGIATVSVTVLALTMDKCLPYRIGPYNYAQYQWAERLADISLFAAIATMIFSIVFRQGLLFVIGALSPVFLAIFIGGVHSGPNPQAWCYNDLRSIEAAKQQLARDLSLTNGTVVSAEQISKYIADGFDSLKCAEHGTYIIGPIGTEPRCTFHGSMSEMETGWKKEMIKQNDSPTR